MHAPDASQKRELYVASSNYPILRDQAELARRNRVLAPRSSRKKIVRSKWETLFPELDDVMPSPVYRRCATVSALDAADELVSLQPRGDALSCHSSLQ